MYSEHNYLLIHRLLRGMQTTVASKSVHHMHPCGYN